MDLEESGPDFRHRDVGLEQRPRDRERTPGDDEVAVGVGTISERCRMLGYFSTLIARAMTKASVDTATRDCSAIMALARRVSGIVSVGENATTLVKLT